MKKRRFVKDADIRQHSLLKSVFLHLLPGALTTLLFVMAAPMLNAQGYPSNLAFLIAGILVLIPFELGFLFYQRKKSGASSSWNGILLYREPMPIKSYVLYASTLLVYSNFILVAVYPPIAQMLREHLFFWLPDWFLMGSTEYPKSTLLTTAIIGLVVNGFVGPITEELYFRGYLLPRLSRFKAWAPVINGVLHALYHFWTPWQVPGWLLSLLPAAFAVWWNRNIFLGMIIHVVGNTIGSLVRLLTLLYP